AHFDDWLALTETLAELAPPELARLGFPELQHEILAAFVADVTTETDEDTAELTAQALRRLWRPAPTYAAAAEWLEPHSWESEPWFEVRFETHPRRRRPAIADELLVERVLRDL